MWKLRAAIGCCGMIAMMLVGCSPGPGVREDRTINWSDDGDTVAFQHGQVGVYVANDEGGALERIFTPDSGVLATSSPLWSPTDRRLIFTTAAPVQPVDDEAPISITNIANDPAGDQFFVEDIRYTCWLRAAVTEEEPTPQPVELFTATCNHPGYVAANLAVRWHPEGNKVLYVDRLESGEHSIFEFDLVTRVVAQVFPHTTKAVIFDWTPNGSHLVCVAIKDSRRVAEEQEKQGGSTINGVWIREAGADEWWHVEASMSLAVGESARMLEAMQATRPAWTKDGQRFVFCSFDAEAERRGDDAHILHMGRVDDHQVATLHRAASPMRDLKWHPAGDRLGFVVTGKTNVLHMIDLDGKLSPEVSTHSVRKFAGWDVGGKRFAYVSPDEIESHAHSDWALLLPPVPEARDRVYVASVDEPTDVNLVHAGMRITFPRWSPTDAKLSLWGTFSPTHRSWWSAYLQLGLMPGDPAAIIDVETNDLAWMAVNAHERRQIGHYHMLKREYEQAWKWYAEAADVEREQPKPSQAEPSRRTLMRQLDFQRSSTFFEYLCLAKLKRDDEAAVKLAQFRAETRVDREVFFGGTASDEATEPSEESDEQTTASNNLSFDLMTDLTQDAYAAEVFLSLDSAVDGVAFFEQQYESATTDSARLSRAFMWTQLLLLSGQHDGYALTVVNELAPLMMRLRTAAEEEVSATSEGLERFILESFGGAAVLPILHPGFAKTLDAETLAKLEQQLPVLRESANDDRERQAIDLALLAIHKAAGRTNEAKALATQIKETYDEDVLTSVQNAITSLRNERGDGR